MWNETVTLYIDDTSIRLLVSQRQRVKKWADVHLEPGLVKDSIVIQEAEIAGRITELLDRQKVKTRKVMLGLSGLHSLTRPATLPQLPRAMLSEAVAREARRVMPVPLDQLYLSWQLIPCPKGRIQVFMAATPRKTIDSLMKTLDMAGLKPYRMAIKPLALTKALPMNTAILIDLQPTEFDIVVMVDGVSQPIRTVTLPNEDQSWEKKMEMVISDLDRTIKFYDTNNPEKPLDPGVPIYVAGELMGEPELSAPIGEASGHPVMQLAPQIKGLEQIDIARYSMNVAMVIKKPIVDREPTFPVANLNLLPAPYQPKPISLTKVIGIPAGVAAAGLVVSLLMLMHSHSTNIATMQNQLDITNQMINQQIAQRQSLQKDIASLQSQAGAAKSTYENLKLTLDTINGYQGYINGDLSVTLSNLNPSINLTSISDSGSQLTLTGNASSTNDVQTFAQTVLNYARNLDSSNRFSKVTISSLSIQPPQTGQTADGKTQTTPGSINFTMVFVRGG